MDVSAPPSLDSACPQAKIELSKHGHRFREWSVDNEEYGQEASLLLSYTKVFKIATFSHKASHEQVMIRLYTKVRQKWKLIESWQTCSWSKNSKQIKIIVRLENVAKLSRRFEGLWEHILRQKMKIPTQRKMFSLGEPNFQLIYLNGNVNNDTTWSSLIEKYIRVHLCQHYMFAFGG